MMQVFITQLCGHANTMGALIQRTIATAARQVNILPMSLFYFDASGEPQAELNSRLDGIIGGLNIGDTMIIQTPTGMTSNYDHVLFDKLTSLRQQMNIKLIAIVEKLVTKKDVNLITLYQQCDALIVPNKAFAEYLQTLGINSFRGINSSRFIFLNYYDFAPTLDFDHEPKYTARLNYINNQSSLSNELKKVNLPISVFQNQGFADHDSFHYAGSFNDDLLLNHINNNGGFGLIWAANEEQEQFLKLASPLAFSAFISAGLPIVTKRQYRIASLVEKKRLGLIVDNLDEAVNKVKALSQEKYQSFAKNIAKMALMTKNGISTKNALIKAVFQANLT